MISAIYEVAYTIYHKYNKVDALEEYRSKLEPYIYMYLLENYGPMLQEHWKTYQPPLKSKNVFVIIERRAHPNFRFILQNIAWAAPDMAVYIFCSDENKPFLEAILSDKIAYYTIVEVFKGNPSCEEGKRDYNNLLTNYSFYESIASQGAKYMMTVQMDNIFRKKLPQSMFVGDYWGNPWFWEKEAAGGGGATMRRLEYMIKLCKEHRPNLEIPINGAEDSWISEKTVTYPSLEFRESFLMESVPAINPYVLHQFWTFANPYIELKKEAFIKYWTHLLTIT